MLPAAIAVLQPLQDRFRGALERMVFPLNGSRLTLMAFEESREGAGIALRADLRLTWPPGVRHRRFTAAGADADTALAELLARTLAEFDASLPGTRAT